MTDSPEIAALKSAAKNLAEAQRLSKPTEESSLRGCWLHADIKDLARQLRALLCEMERKP